MKTPMNWILLTLLSFSVSAFGENAKPSASQGVENNAIEIYEVKPKEGDQNPYIQVPITHEVFSFSRNTDLSDLIAVDASKHLLPIRLVTITPTSEVSDEETGRCNLPFIPVAADLNPDALRELQSTQVKISNEKNKTLTQIQKQTKVLDQKTPEFYLIDLKALEQDSNQIEIAWEPAAQAEYVEVEIEATRNLEDWESLGRKMLVQATSIRADKNDHQFLDNRISLRLSQNEYDYLRVKVSRGGEFFKLTGVQALQIKKQVHRLKPLVDTWTLEGIESPQQSAVNVGHQTSQTVAAWEYVRTESTPIDSLSLELGDISYADTIRLYSRNSDKSDWQLVYQGPWIHVQVGSDWQTGNAISLYNNQQKYWRLEMNQTSQGIIPPKLSFLWQPYYLQIIASNKPPFLLAIDMQAAGKKPTDQIFNQLLAKANPVWSHAELVSLNIDPEYTQQPVNAASSWRQWLFWLCLMIAVVVLFIFSWKLLKELKQNPLGTDEKVSDETGSQS